eukprot:TRINITY_DN5633_c0_g1_i1.p3 TRINITY_DN5633_c0_g1~~TRINITY_DN5633_c0_g1_i1.p3  ORF type:complete len:136 (+),score=24.92 TRINITY_DN5633_c0_g1_i1:14-421(+)
MDETYREPKLIFTFVMMSEPFEEELSKVLEVVPPCVQQRVVCGEFGQCSCISRELCMDEPQSVAEFWIFHAELFAFVCNKGLLACVGWHCDEEGCGGDDSEDDCKGAEHGFVLGRGGGEGVMEDDGEGERGSERR